MLCVEIYTECLSEHISYYGDCTDGHILVSSVLDDTIEVESWCEEYIIVSSDFYEGIFVSAESNDSIVIDSYSDPGIEISSDLYEGITVWSDCDDMIDIDSDCECGIIVNAVFEPDQIHVDATGMEAMLIYSSYVCTVTKDGYLYLQEMYNEQPVTIFVNPQYEIDVNVFSNLNWFVN